MRFSGQPEAPGGAESGDDDPVWPFILSFYLVSCLFYLFLLFLLFLIYYY